MKHPIDLHFPPPSFTSFNTLCAVSPLIVTFLFLPPLLPISGLYPTRGLVCPVALCPNQP
ncbi:hypothetical protein BDV25DRAFT_61152 [Aspergillus avenaceus]|uniref:Uncharacterized protein n=1 Tax=Aspergillus avenaceus TaxID=36643 RepID=A0A5N6TIA1_ASPAV|nr:hypothetical protein BDV25DRAFT_61152 [Aspergillus avenaceus]